MRISALAIALCLAVATASARATPLDQAALIQGLARQGLDELLAHLAETDAANDAALRETIDAARLRVAWQNADPAARPEAYQRLRRALANLPTEHHQHPLGPLWRIDHAELLLLNGLSAMHRHAVLFAAVGVATSEQRQVLGETTAEATELLRRAAADLNVTPDLEAQTPGERLRHDYVRVRLPYLRAYAAFAVSLAADAINAESLNDALPPLAAIIERSTSAEARRNARLLTGLIHLHLRRTDAAGAAFNAVIDAGRGDLSDLTARLGRTLAQPHEPWPTTLEQHEQVRGQLLMRLLVADVQHRRLLAALPRGQVRRGALAQAYAVYRSLLESLPDEQARQLEAFLASRWAEHLPIGDDLELLPAWVAVAAGRAARAAERFDLAARLLTRVAEDETADPGQRIAAMVEQGWLTLQAGDDRAAATLAASRWWTRPAEATPDHPDVLPALAQAALQLLAHHHDPRHGDAITAEYARVARLLLHRYTHSGAAHENRHPFAAVVLMPAGRWSDAVAVLQAVPIDHPAYSSAQAAMLHAHLALYRAADADDRPALASSLRRQANALLNAQPPPAIAEQVGTDLAELDLLAGDAAAALATLHDLANERAAGLRLLALIELHRWDEAARATRGVTAPEDALHRLAAQLDEGEAQLDLAADAAQRRAVQSWLKPAAGLAVTLAAAALDDETLTAERRLAVQLEQVRALRLAGRATEAQALLDPLLPDHADNADVILHAGEVAFARGDPPALRRAAAHFNRIIAAFDRPPYPDLYWRAWLRRLQVMALLDENPSHIPLRLRQLRQLDPTLGGDRYRIPLERLAETP